MARGHGRQRVVQRIQNESKLQVNFSKCRSGLFKKASELSTLCGAEVAIIVFSPGGKVYSFGHPGLHNVIDRFISRNPPPIDDETNQIIHAQQRANQQMLNFQLTQLGNLLEAEKRRGQFLDQMWRERERQHWWERPIEELDLQQLEQLKTMLEDLQKCAMEKAKMLEHENVAPFLSLRPTSSFRRGVNVPVNAWHVLAPGDVAPFNAMVSAFNGSFQVGTRGSGFNGVDQFDARTNGSSGGVPSDRRIPRPFGRESFDPRAPGPSYSSPFDRSTVGSFDGVSFAPRAPGFNVEVPNNHMAAGSSSGMPFNLREPEFSGEVKFNPMTARPRGE